MRKITATAGDVLIGGGNPIVVQTMCNTHTSDIEGTVAQCIRMKEAGARMIRITVPGPADVANIAEIRRRLRSGGIDTPLVADIHFSSRTAIDVAPHVEKVRVNPGNFHRDHAQALEIFSELIDVCRDNGTAIRVGLNHGSLGEYITNLYGNTPLGMAKAAMEWLGKCVEKDFYNVVVSLKASNTKVMSDAYLELEKEMEAAGTVFPVHVGVTEAGNGDTGRIKSCVGISSVLSKGIGDTIRVSLTEEPVNEIPVARYLADRYDRKLFSSLVSIKTEGKKAIATYEAPSRERLLLDASCDWGKELMEKKLDEIEIHGTFTTQEGALRSIDEDGLGDYLVNEIMQASRRRFYKPEYIACPGCGRTMYDLQKAFEEVKERTAGMKDVVIAVMGCIVNGPGEMADADWGYVGEGNHKVTIYHKDVPVLRHVPDTEAVDRLVELIESERD